MVVKSWQCLVQTSSIKSQVGKLKCFFFKQFTWWGCSIKSQILCCLPLCIFSFTPALSSLLFYPCLVYPNCSFIRYHTMGSKSSLSTRESEMQNIKTPFCPRDCTSRSRMKIVRPGGDIPESCPSCFHRRSSPPSYWVGGSGPTSSWLSAMGWGWSTWSQMKSTGCTHRWQWVRFRTSMNVCTWKPSGGRNKGSCMWGTGMLGDLPL